MTTKTDQPVKGKVRVMLAGVNERVQAALDLLFRKEMAGRFALVSDTPDVAIFDYDQPNVAQQWSAFQSRFPRLPTLIVSYLPVLPSNTDTTGGGEQRTLSKPIQPQRLIKELNELASRPAKHVRSSVEQPADSVPPLGPKGSGAIGYSSAGSGATAAAIDDRLAEAEHLYERDAGLDPLDRALLDAAGAQFDPGEHMLGVLRSAVTTARSTNTTLVLSGVLEAIKILVRPDRDGELLFDPPGVDLRQACLRSVSQRAVQIHRVGAHDQRLQQPGWRSAEEVLWEVALRSSRGRLPLGTPTAEPLTLTRWPNFTRLMESPHAMQIAALMVRRPISLNEVIAQLRIEPGATFAFFTAADAIGLFVETRVASEVAVPSDLPRIDPPAASAGLLTRLLHKLNVSRR